MQPNKGDAYNTTQRVEFTPPYPFTAQLHSTKKLLLQVRVTDPRLDEKTKGPQSGRCQKIRLSATRELLNRPIRHDVQCRDQSVMDCLLVRSHPNKVSMERKEKRRRDRGSEENYTRSSTLVASEIRVLEIYWFASRLKDFSVAMDGDRWR